MHLLRQHHKECQYRSIEVSKLRWQKRSVPLLVCFQLYSQCDYCDKQLRACDLQEHIERFCPHTKKPCCHGCGQLIGPEKVRLNHEEYGCPERTVRCPLDCGREMPAREIELHTSTQCPNRLVPCPLGCGRHQRPHLIPQHTQDGERGFCPKRRIRCPNGEGLTHGPIDCYLVFTTPPSVQIV